MASGNNSVQRHLYPQQQHLGSNNTSSGANLHYCKECEITLNSAESLEVHLQYHKENLLNKWSTNQQQQQPSTTTTTILHSEENNNTKPATTIPIKREFIPNSTNNSTAIVAADSSDAMKKGSPEYNNRHTPDTIFPPNSQNYPNIPSPYHNAENAAFSPNFQYQQQAQIKQENNSSSPRYQNYNHTFNESQFFEQQQSYQEYNNVQKNYTYRHHPYQQNQQQQQHFDRPQSQVSSSSPAYVQQPTPSPSPKQCDKCTFVSDSPTQLIEHLNLVHPPTSTTHLNFHQQFVYNNNTSQIKQEDDSQSEILDLDSHKVHQIYPQDDDKRINGDLSNHNAPPHSVNSLLNSWSPPHQSKLYHHQFTNGNGAEQKLYTADAQKIFPPPPQLAHQQNQDYVTTSQDSVLQPNYRSFEHLPSPSSTSVISSTQLVNGGPQSTLPPANAKSTNWKSNEARRPKTYNCTACNKWFTSSGHLKRHYNTTLHKNAVKTSGNPDPATLPISVHHHPSREPHSRNGDITNSNSSDDHDDGRSPPLTGLMQQSPLGPYDRQMVSLPSPNLQPPLHSALSPVNGDAGLSPTSLDSRGLLSLTPTPHMAPPPPHTYGMPPPPHLMDNGPQFQMYPNESAPHVTLVMPTTSNHSITGKFNHQEIEGASNSSNLDNTQPLPSFANFQAGRYDLLVTFGNSNVGGGGAVTAPYTPYLSESIVIDEPPKMLTSYKSNEEDDYKLTVLSVAEPVADDLNIYVYEAASSDDHTNNNNDTKTNNNNIDVISRKRPLKVDTSPKKSKCTTTKGDYEERTSPLISSTTVQANIPKQSVHKCVDCDKLFNKACYLTQHNKTFHCGDKPFKCSRCGKRFSNEDNYHEHILKHAGDKPHKCDLCPKQFNHKTDLRRHMCLHTGQKPYACDTCGKGFIRKDHMLKHCETHFKNKTRTPSTRKSDYTTLSPLPSVT